MSSKLIIHLIRLIILMFILTLSACTTNQAEDLFETAQFEELQNNREHAQQLYEDILKKYPQSEYAQKAETRLSEMRASGDNNGQK